MDSNTDFWHLSHFSSYLKTVRMLAWVFRFVYNSRKCNPKRRGELTVEEIEYGENFLLKLIQSETFSGENSKRIGSLDPFHDKNGLIRLKTRVSNRQDTTAFRFPVVLPCKHPIVDSLIRKVHLDYCHIGPQGILSKLREKYWIISGRRTVKSVLAKCVTCKRYAAKPFKVKAPPLPVDRVREARVFEVTGVDMAGPLYLKSGEKVWVCLFTCAVFRAVHLELVTSLSTHCFMQALRRFSARRGRPKTIYSDNGTNFRGAENALSQLNWNEITTESTVQQIVWRFNPPSAPWWGGFWERLVGILKQLLRKVLGRASLNYEELLTVLCDCEAVINARPLTHVSDDPKDLIAITPAMFLADQTEYGLPDCDSVERASLCRKLRYKQKLRDDLRRRFRSEYLGQLKSFSESGSRRTEIKLGDIVLIGDDHTKRMDWPLARVVEILPGKDQRIRLVKVETAKGQLLRPVQRLYCLECVDASALNQEESESAGVSGNKNKVPENECAEVSGNKSRVPVVTRSGRVSVPPSRFGC
ncbi:hypothetical protein NQ315_017031 [Exocentrus adspersus]|uniref:Integrase catalytic domain-containing protein n=1 Tax=Exocentrus adspersus TaxID=1586481 RepID=A0AAV8V5Y8_9CUCU|nr:hypothetical protein NQ315_017031 [Exocentrus adspersus]